MKKQAAIKYFGSISKLAEALNIKSQAVSQWNEDVPIMRQFQIELITNGDLKADFSKRT